MQTQILIIQVIGLISKLIWHYSVYITGYLSGYILDNKLYFIKKYLENRLPAITKILKYSKIPQIAKNENGQVFYQMCMVII